MCHFNFGLKCNQTFTWKIWSSSSFSSSPCPYLPLLYWEKKGNRGDGLQAKSVMIKSRIQGGLEGQRPKKIQLYNLTMSVLHSPFKSFIGKIRTQASIQKHTRIEILCSCLKKKSNWLYCIGYKISQDRLNFKTTKRGVPSNVSTALPLL